MNTPRMDAAATIISVATSIALIVLAVAFFLAVWRVVKGPTLPDRVVALDMLVGIVIGFIALIAIRTGFTLYIDIAISLGLVGFLATVAFARFILSGAGRQAAAGAASAQAAAPASASRAALPDPAPAKAVSGKKKSTKGAAPSAPAKTARKPDRKPERKPGRGPAGKPEKPGKGK
jgi:multicomponent Na+:H+ antiporter subunit F